MTALAITAPSDRPADAVQPDPWVAGAIFAIPTNLASHAAAASASVQRVRTTLTGFSTPQAVRRALEDIRAAQAELAAVQGEMEAFFPVH